MTMMCYDLMCAWKLSRGQLSLAHSTKVKHRHARENKKNSWSPWSQSGGWKGRRTMEETICGKDEFWAWSGRENEWWMVTVVMKEMTNWCEWDQMRVIGLHDQQEEYAEALYLNDKQNNWQWNWDDGNDVYCSCNRSEQCWIIMLMLHTGWPLFSHHWIPGLYPVATCHL